MGPEGRYLIVNADDFGQSEGVNRGVIEAHEKGIVTSASLMVRWPAAADAAVYAMAHPELSLGIHLDLGEWACRDGEWIKLYEVVPDDDADAVAAEVERQIAMFFDLVGKAPTHIDSHQHSHRKEPVRSVAVAAARRLGIPLRGCIPSVRYSGEFYGQSDDGTPYHELISVEGLMRILETLPVGVTELGCHPALENDLNTVYLAEREIEVKTLCDPRINKAIRDLGIIMCPFQREHALP